MTRGRGKEPGSRIAVKRGGVLLIPVEDVLDWRKNDPEMFSTFMRGVENCSQGVLL